MPYQASKLITIATGYAQYTINSAETLAVLLGAAYFSGVATGTVIEITDGTLGGVVPRSQSGLIFRVDGAGTLQPLGVSPAQIVTATKTVSAVESGATFFLNSATEFVSTLPAPALGLRYTFIVTAAPSGASYTIVTTSSANIIKGQVYTLDVNSATDADFETSGGDTVSFVDGKSIAGDRVDVFCDGTNWFVHGFCSVFDAITITTAS